MHVSKHGATLSFAIGALRPPRDKAERLSRWILLRSIHPTDIVRFAPKATNQGTRPNCRDVPFTTIAFRRVLRQRPHSWHSRAVGGAVHSIKSRLRPINGLIVIEDLHGIDGLVPLAKTIGSCPAILRHHQVGQKTINHTGHTKEKGGLEGRLCVSGVSPITRPTALVPGRCG